MRIDIDPATGAPALHCCGAADPTTRRLTVRNSDLAAVIDGRTTRRAGWRIVCDECAGRDHQEEECQSLRPRTLRTLLAPDLPRWVALTNWDAVMTAVARGVTTALTGSAPEVVFDEVAS